MTVKPCESADKPQRSSNADLYNERPKNWLREPLILRISFVFWVIVHGVAEGAFKRLSTVTDVLTVRPPKGRELYTLE